MASKVRSIKRAIEKRQAAASTITVTLREVMNSMAAINSLIAQPMEARQAFKLARVVKLIRPDVDTFNETRVKLLEKHGKLNEEKANYEFETPEAEAAFNQELKELLDTELTLQTQRVSIETIQGASLSAGAMLDLDWLISE